VKTLVPRPYDVAVVGGGLLGLATARALLSKQPRLRLVVIEQEPELARHQSGRNSGVVHRGIYYTPRSLKARLCTTGADRLTAYCESRGIGWQRVGKVIIASNETEEGRLLDLYQRGVVNGVPGLELIGPERLRELEPASVGVRAIHSPHTGIVDYRLVALAYADDVRQLGGEIRVGTRVHAIEERPDGAHLVTDGEEVAAHHVVACAGLQSDRVAAMTDAGALRKMRIIPFRGDYYVLRPERAALCRSLIYPVPDPRFPFLGVHFTRRVDGTVWAGPNAVLALSREGYRRTDVRLRDVRDTLTFGGFWRLAGRHWRMGMDEAWRDVVRRSFANALRRYVPELDDDDLLPGPAGNRAQAVAGDGSLVDDFAITGSRRSIHVRNAPSPGATSSLAIGELIAAHAERRLSLGG
jgi:L-2-hydroxyglutarate oxidase LhgO